MFVFDEYSVYTCVLVIAVTYLMYDSIIVDCGPPPSITDGSPGTPTSTTLGGTVTYTCNSGYTLSGSPTVTCLSGGSWSARPTCIGM